MRDLVLVSLCVCREDWRTFHSRLPLLLDFNLTSVHLCPLFLLPDQWEKVGRLFLTGNHIHNSLLSQLNKTTFVSSSFSIFLADFTSRMNPPSQFSHTH